MNEITETFENRMKFSFETKAIDVFRSAQLSDRQKGIVRRRNIEAVAIFVVFFYFGAQVVLTEDITTLNMVMCGISMLALLALWQYPLYVNRTFALSKEKTCPEVTIAVSENGLHVEEEGAKYDILFDDGFQAFEHQTIIAINHGKNRILTIPTDQMEEDAAKKLSMLLKEKLKEKYRFIPVKDKCRQRIPWLD